MRHQANAGADSATGLNRTSPWSVIEVRVLPGYRLDVWFEDGVRGQVDLSRLIFSNAAGVFETLRDPAVFARVHIERGAATFPGDLDLAPDAMHDALEHRGRWTPE